MSVFCHWVECVLIEDNHAKIDPSADSTGRNTATQSKQVKVVRLWEVLVGSFLYFLIYTLINYQLRKLEQIMCLSLHLNWLLVNPDLWCQGLKAIVCCQMLLMKAVILNENHKTRAVIVKSGVSSGLQSATILFSHILSLRMPSVILSQVVLKTWKWQTF